MFSGGFPGEVAGRAIRTDVPLDKDAYLCYNISINKKENLWD
jgi:hypothetical protein